MSERDAFDLTQTLNYANYLIRKMAEHEPTKQQPMPISSEPLIPGSHLAVRKDIMVPCVGYDPKHHDPNTYYRLVFNPLSGNGKLVLQSELDATREQYRSQHGGVGA